MCDCVCMQDSPLSLQLQLRRTMAELTVWQKQKANGIYTSIYIHDPSVLDTMYSKTSPRVETWEWGVLEPVQSCC